MDFKSKTAVAIAVIGLPFFVGFLASVPVNLLYTSFTREILPAGITKFLFWAGFVGGALYVIHTFQESGRK